MNHRWLHHAGRPFPGSLVCHALPASQAVDGGAQGAPEAPNNGEAGEGEGEAVVDAAGHMGPGYGQS
jgi:hypothetical protein